MKRAGVSGTALLCGAVAAGFAFCASAQNSEIFGIDGSEYLITSAGRLPGEQTNPSLALGAKGGFVVWQDNVSDLDGLGISAQRLDSSYQPVYGEFCVNEIAKGDQENAKVAMFADGGAIFTWQSGVRGMQKAAYRVMSANGVFASEQNLAQDGYYQSDVRVAVLSDGNALITWSVTDTSGKPQGVYMQKVSARGEKIGNPVAVAKGLGIRSSAVSTLENGGFAVAWLEESLAAVSGSGESFTAAKITTNVKVQFFANDLTASSAARTVSPANSVVSNPTIAVGPYGAAVAWSVVDTAAASQTWDVSGAVVDLTGQVTKTFGTFNTCLVGDQFIPQLTAVAENYLAVWTSLRQDGSFEGVYGRLLNASGFVSDEFRVNTTTQLRQIHPTVASSDNHIVVAWSSYLTGEYSFDLQAQRYLCDSDGIVLAQPEAPFAYALTEYEIFVSWPEIVGRDVAQYDLFIDDLPAVSLTRNFYALEDVDMASTHTFKYRYTLKSGVVSPTSDATFVTTWGADKNRDGLPDDWQSLYFGDDKKKWPAGTVDSDNDGVSNLDEFLTGTNPMDPESVLKMEVKSTSQGVRLQWNTVPGFVYQVQSSEDSETWTNLGAVRRAVSKVDSIALDPGAGKCFYRLIRLGGK